MSEELVTRIGRLRLEAELEAPEPKESPGRKQVNEIDGAIMVSANMAGKSDVERRAALREVRPGATITASGASKTRLTRDEKISKLKTWAESLDENARAEYLAGEKFAAKSERVQTIIEEAFEAIDLTSDAGDEVDWNLQALDQDAPYGIDEEDDADEAQEWAPVMPWEKRDVNGNLYEDSE
jgi:hypothetical protein